MFGKILTRSLATFTACAALLAMALVGGAANSTSASPKIADMACNYAAPSTTQTHVSVVYRNGNFTAVVKVTGPGQPSGTVSVTLNGTFQGTATLHHGMARVPLHGVQIGSNTVSATYAPANACYQASHGSKTFRANRNQVLGVQAHRNHGGGAGNQGNNRPGAVVAAAQGLVNTGANLSTDLFALLGVVLVGAGGVVLVKSRRHAKA